MLEWAEDNGLTPLLAVDATKPGVRVPPAYVQDGRITLNVGFSAMHQREVSNEYLTGHARFGGRSEQLELPMAAIEALVVRETGEGMVFPVEPADEASNESTGVAATSTSPGLSLVSGVADEDDTGPEPPEPPRPRGKPHLKLVK